MTYSLRIRLAASVCGVATLGAALAFAGASAANAADSTAAHVSAHCRADVPPTPEQRAARKDQAKAAHAPEASARTPEQRAAHRAEVKAKQDAHRTEVKAKRDAHRAEVKAKRDARKDCKTLARKKAGAAAPAAPSAATVPEGH